jgi:hypothetical protein
VLEVGRPVPRPGRPACRTPPARGLAVAMIVVIASGYPVRPDSCLPGAGLRDAGQRARHAAGLT